MKYACIAKDSSGGRCDWPAIEVDGKMIFCGTHLNEPGVELAPTADVVLVRLCVGERTRKFLETSGIRRVERDEAALTKEHTEAASEVGRNPSRFAPKPEVASGARIFGEEGIPDVQGPAELFRELAEAGYLMNEAHWFRRQLKGAVPRVGAGIVIGFSKSGPAAEAKEIITDLAEDRWQFARVWANPPREGSVVHCAEFYGRQAGRRRGRFALRFLSGLWAAEPLPEQAEEIVNDRAVAGVEEV